ncbi:methyltransferase UbiE [Massarina eburnea CBS 473.64]|uniref:Methyltransferase UbiE n=1 Tax=Massarina eburnea CBS 473.64 TaxID=1395130 RepID=A0A6A6SA97_9PLEO|nr:methyltransferase UbiE [Massarina eburnea CBS 473.64]
MSKPQYLHGHHPSVLRSHTWRTAANSCPHLLPHLLPTHTILDIGCGPGTITVDLATLVPSGHVLGIDPSASVIKQARAHAASQNIPNVRFEVGDIFAWRAIPGIAEESFDIIHAHQVLQHLTSPVLAVQEMKKLAKPGGLVAVRDVDYSAMSHYPPHPGMRKWLRLYTSVAESLQCDPNIGKRLHAVAMEAGFARADIEASASTWVFSTPEEREFWCGVWAERTVKSDYRERVLESGLGTVGDLEEIAGTWREMEGRVDGWFLVVNGQVVCWKRG